MADTKYTKQAFWLQPAQQPHGMSKTSFYSMKNAAYFSVGEESSSTLMELGFSDRQAEDFVANGAWQVRFTEYAETHKEAVQVKNVFGDTFVAFSAEAMPIDVNMSGYVYQALDQDHRLDFIKLYHEKLRGSELENQRLVLVFVVRDTIMRLRIRRIQITEDSQLDGWARIAMQGVGFKYAVYAMNEDLTGYDDFTEEEGVAADPLSDDDLEYVTS